MWVCRLPYLNPKNVLVKGPARNWTIKKDFGEDQIALILMFLRSELNGNRSNAMSNIILYESKQTNCGQEFPNPSLLAELVFALCESNSSVERAISFFGQMSQNVACCFEARLRNLFGEKDAKAQKQTSLVAAKCAKYFNRNSHRRH